MNTPTTSARLDELTERRVAESVRRRGITRSDWLREAVEAAIKAETDGKGEAAIVASLGERMAALEGDLSQARKIADDNLLLVKELSKAVAIERAADRAVAQQVYRMAFRAAYLVVKQFTDEVPEEQRDDLGADLCAESDELYSDLGLARLDQVMRDAREELRQSIERAGTS